MTERPWKKKRPDDELALATATTATSSTRSTQASPLVPSPLSLLNQSPTATGGLGVGAFSSTAGRSGSVSVSTHLTLLHQQQEIDNYKSELRHEQTARALDSKKSSQRLARLEQQVALAKDEAGAARDALTETTVESERHIQQLTTARDRAASLNRQLQLQLQEANDATAKFAVVQAELEQSKNNCQHLQEQVQLQRENEKSFQHEIQNLKKTVEQKLEAAHRARTTGAGTDTYPASPLLVKLLEDAPPAVLQELNRCRIKLAETERFNRQCLQKLDDATKRSHELVRANERSQQEARRYPVVVAKLDELQVLYEREHAELVAWRDLGDQVSAVFRQNMTSTTHGGGGSSGGSAVRLEPMSVLRHVTKLQSDWQAACQSVTKYKTECDRLHRESIVGGASLEGSTSESQWRAKEREWQVKLETTLQQVQTAQLEAALFQREADSLRQLIQTFEQQDELPVGSGGGDSSASRRALDTTAPTLQVRLNRVTEQYNLAREQQTALTQKLEACQTEQLASTAELERVRDKFFKLRTALGEEKEKVAAFEARVVQAEQLAGKGSFDPRRTQVLHLTETPLIQSLKEQVEQLQSQLADSVVMSDKRLVSGGVGDSTGTSDVVTGSSGVANPDKLNQRLKETFKEQIAIFREAVYLMTGFKVDMLTGMDRPTFRLRSVFAENEEDQLLLQWPKTKVKDDATSLDILQTDLAKLLTTTLSYEYMTKFHSLPAFLASVQLSLFEKQTVTLS